MKVYEKFKELTIAEKGDFIRWNNYQDSLSRRLSQITGDWWFTHSEEKKYEFKDFGEFYTENKDKCTVTYMGKDLITVHYIEDELAVEATKGKKVDDFYFYIKDKTFGTIARERFVSQYLKPVVPKSKINVNLLQHSPREGYYLKKYAINDNENLDLESNYNDGFKDIHEKVISRITTKGKSMTIFHGVPGCGKTTYLRYLIAQVGKKDTKVVYLPPNVTQLLANPDFVSSLELFKHSVVVIEDAEGVLVKNGNRSQAISNILNVTDGILADIFNIHFIFTFNVEVSAIDPALLRKGRLDLKYEFKELSSDKVKALCEKLGTKFDSKMTLAEVYNSEENIVDNKEVKKLGF